MTNEVMRAWMSGAIAMGYLVVAFFFLRFWRETRERLFLFFTGGFLILVLHRAFFGLTYGRADLETITFGLRLAGFLVILIGILDRRFRRDRPDSRDL
ncbi:MAG: hypothetical protein JJE51_14920 [Thermoanaerobaculia bacterium]|nr:hypothetical protein [Thermoanaerobaculia bacterium]